MSPSSTSSRWCPTPEQLMILEELYRGGIRTPNAPQIQRITAHLSLYGRIEGKNVFYWFQNHKARDRQKLRRKLIKQLQQQQLCHYDLEQLQLNQSNYHLLNYFDPPVSSDFIQLPYHSSASFLPQVGGLEGATPEMINYTWKLEIPQMFQMENPMMRMCGHDWVRMVDVGSPSPCCTRPLKTLELFPITTTNVKEEYCSSTSSKHLPYDATSAIPPNWKDHQTA